VIFQAPYVQSGPHSAVIGALKVLMQAGSTEARRDAIGTLKEALSQFPQVEQPLTHHFLPGLYQREVFNPKGCLIITKKHKESNFSFVMRGRLLVITEDGQRTIEAPAYFKTHPGTERVLYSMEDTVFLTVHPNPSNCEDLALLEDRLAEGGMS